MKKIIAIFLALFCAAVFGATTVPVQLLNPAGSSSGQTIVSTGASTAPGWGGMGLSGLSSIPANTLVGNATGSSAVPTAISVTGTGSPILNISPTIATPTLTGVTGGACASAGNLGECKNSNVVKGSAVSLTNNVEANITSVSLTAGNWLCYGNVGFNPAGTTLTSQELGWISTASATLPTPTNSGAEVGLTTLGSTGGGNADILPVGMIMLNVTTTTTAYLSAYASFTTSTLTAYGALNCFRWH